MTEKEAEWKEAHYNPEADEIYHEGDSVDRARTQVATQYARGGERILQRDRI